MPIHEYRCPSGHTSEIIDVSNKTRLPWMECPHCGDRADKVPSVTQWQMGTGPKESPVSAAIARVKRAERHGHH